MRADAVRACEVVARHPALLGNLDDPLTTAAGDNEVDSIRLLVELGADVNAKDNKGRIRVDQTAKTNAISLPGRKE